MSKEIVSIAQEYLNAREESRETEHDIDALRDDREDWESKMEGLDEDDPLYALAKENYDEVDEKINQALASKDATENQEEELLRATAERFIPTGEWTNEEVLHAINLAVLNERDNSIRVGTTKIASDLEIEEDEVVFEIATAVREVAKSKIGKSSNLEEFWNDFKQLDRFQYFEIIATSDEPLTGGDIAEALDQEDRRQAISQGLIDTTKRDLNPYYKEGRGEYSLSFVGKYLLHEFAEDSLLMTDEDEPDQEDDSDDDATLNSFE